MKPLVTDALWERLQPLLPPPPPRRFRFPGRKPLDARQILTEQEWGVVASGLSAGLAAMRATADGDELAIGEGIETCLAAMQARDLPAWAALSTSGLLALGLPPELRDVIVLADGDEAGKAAAQGAALRWKREGRRVRIAHASDGLDFNDMLLGQVSSKEGRLQ